MKIILILFAIVFSNYSHAVTCVYSEPFHACIKSVGENCLEYKERLLLVVNFDLQPSHCDLILLNRRDYDNAVLDWQSGLVQSGHILDLKDKLAEQAVSIDRFDKLVAGGLDGEKEEPFSILKASALFSFFFSFVIGLWFFSKNIGLILSAVRRW